MSTRPIRIPLTPHNQAELERVAEATGMAKRAIVDLVADHLNARLQSFSVAQLVQDAISERLAATQPREAP